MKKYFILILFLTPVIVFSQLKSFEHGPSDFGWKYVGNQGFSPGEVEYISSAFNSGGQLFVSFLDLDYLSFASVMTFDGSSWNLAGIRGFSQECVWETSIAVCPTENQAYIAFSPHDIHGIVKPARVMKFNGSNWVNVGNPYFSAGKTAFINLVFNSTGQPFVAYRDDTNSYKATVMKFDGTNWVNVGNPGFSQGKAYFTTLAFNTENNQPYIAFQDFSNSQKATVMKFDGASWVNVGNPGFSPGQADFTSIAFNPADTQPYIAFQDYSNGQKATVMKFDGTNWVYVGNQGVSQGKADFISFAINPLNNQLYIAFEDYGNSQKVTVMRFDGNNWMPVGPEGFSAGSSYFIALAINSSGVPHVAFLDDANSGKATVMKFDSVYTGIKTPLKTAIFLFPNPSNGEITIGKSRSEPILLTHVEIFDYSGKLISCIEGPVKDKLNLTFLPDGLYLLSAFNRDSRYTFKFAIFYNN